MREIVIVSGKGGTGKTVFVASLAFLASRKVLADCDVDAPDLHLLLSPEIEKSSTFYGLDVARIDPILCDRGKRCAPYCRYGALRFPDNGDFYIDPSACEGCGVCVRFCHTGAIRMEKRVSGKWYISRTAYGPLVHARLDPGQEASGKLVTEVRNQARLIAERDNFDYVIIDGPPGIGCPAISAITGVDEIIAVAEPTLSGMHDLERIFNLAQHFGISARAVVNKFDLNTENTAEIESLCQQRGIEVLGRIPFDPLVVDSLARAQPVVKDNDGDASRAIRGVWQKLEASLIESKEPRSNSQAQQTSPESG